MNYVYYSGYLTYTEIVIRCRLLSKTNFLIIQNIIQICQNKKVTKTLTGNVFYQNKKKPIRAKCSKCKFKCVVRNDPFQWVNGLRCRICLPKTITFTKACALLPKHKHALLNTINKIQKKSPFGNKMTLYLLADIVVLCIFNIC